MMAAPRQVDPEVFVPPPARPGCDCRESPRSPFARRAISQSPAGNPRSRPAQSLTSPRPFPSLNAEVCNPPGYTGQPDAPNSRERLSSFQAYKLVKLEPDGTRRPLSSTEIKEFEKSHASQCEWNSSRGGQKQWQKQCLAIIKKLRSQRKQAWAFNEPVDPVALNIPDYPDIIKHPMDLATLEGLLVSGAIETPDRSWRRCGPSSATPTCTTGPGAGTSCTRAPRSSRSPSRRSSSRCDVTRGGVCLIEFHREADSAQEVAREGGEAGPTGDDGGGINNGGAGETRGKTSSRHKGRSTLSPVSVELRAHLTSISHSYLVMRRVARDILLTLV